MRTIAWLKSKIRRTRFYRFLLRVKARRQEQNYLSLRDSYHHRNPDFFSSPGYQFRSLELLQRRLGRAFAAKKSTRDVRLFVVDIPGREGPWFESEFDRSFDAATFSVSRHMRGFDHGMADLVAHSSGVDPRDQLDSAFYRVRGSWSDWFARLQMDLLDAVTTAHRARPIDLLFIYGGYGQIAPETLGRIRSLGIPVAILSLDDKHSFLGNRRGGPYGPDGLVNCYDVHLTNSLGCVSWYVAEGVPAFYFPQGFDPEFFGRADGLRDIEVGFVGQAYGYRLEFIRALRRAGVPVQCFGSGWENGIVEDRINVFCRSRINLGIGATGLTDKMTCIKGRDFETAASGGVYLTTFDPDLANLFTVGKEILCYRNEVDCVEQIRYYLQNPEEAERIGRAGRERCLAEHTWTHRMASLLRWMGILEA